MKISTRKMILVALFTALTVVGAYIKIPIGPVPITLQIIFTALAGVILGANLGALSQIVYVLLGLFGVPVFASGKVGPSAIFSLSFGYSIGFILAAYVIGRLVESTKNLSYIKLFFSCLAGFALIYIIGVPYLYFIFNYLMGKNIGILGAIKIGFIVFIPGDIAKCLVVTILGKKLVSVLKKGAYI